MTPDDNWHIHFGYFKFFFYYPWLSKMSVCIFNLLILEIFSLCVIQEGYVSSFEMTDLILMSSFLDIEVIQQDGWLFISPRKYAIDILKKFRMENSKPVSTPIEEKLKLTEEDKGRRVDPTYYNSLARSLRYFNTTRPDIVYGGSWKSH